MPVSNSKTVQINFAVAGGAVGTSGFRRLMVAVAHTETANRIDGPFADPDAVASALGGTSAEPYKAAQAAFAQSPSLPDLVIGRIDSVGDTDLTDSLTQIRGAMTKANAFYGMALESRADADILLAAAWAESRDHLMLLQTDSADLLAGTPGNIGEQLRTSAYNNTALIYHPDDAEYLDAAWAGRCLAFDLDAVNGRGRWAWRQLGGVPFSNITDAQAANIEAENANYYAETESSFHTWPGTVASGRKIPVTTSTHWFKKRLQERIIGKQISAVTTIPRTNSGVTGLIGEALATAQDGVDFGHFSSDVPPEIVNIPNVKLLGPSDPIRFGLRVKFSGDADAVVMDVVAKE